MQGCRRIISFQPLFRAALVAGAASCALLAVETPNWLAGAPPQEGPTMRLYEENSRWAVVEIGPIDLPAAASHDDVANPAAAALPYPADAYLHGFEYELVDHEGRAVPTRVLHHMNLIVPRERELFSNIMLRLGAAGPETGRVMLPRLLGYPISRGDTLLVTAMFHNPEPTSYRGVRLLVRIRQTPAGTLIRPVSVKPIYLDVMPPDSRHSFDLHPGWTERSWEGSPAVGGRILGVGGHLHRYGLLLRLEDVTAGRVLWEAKPEVDENGDVVSMPVARFFLRLGLSIRPEHTYRLTAIYHNPTDSTIAGGGMGTLGGVFIPAWGAEWPDVDRKHPQYQRDLRLVHSGHGHNDESGHGRGGVVSSDGEGSHQHHR